MRDVFRSSASVQPPSYGNNKPLQVGFRDLHEKVELVFGSEKLLDHPKELLLVLWWTLKRHRRPCQIFSAAGPFCPLTISNSTFCPSESDLKPEPWIAE